MAFPFAEWRKLTKQGSKNPKAKLNDDAVRAIRVRAALGERSVALAREFGVSPGCVSHILIGRTWTHVV